MTTAAHPASVVADLTDPDVMQAGVPHEAMRALRRTAPVSFVDAPGIRQLGEPRRLCHGWINGVKELEVSYR